MLNLQLVAGEHGLFGAHESEDIRTICLDHDHLFIHLVNFTFWFSGWHTPIQKNILGLIYIGWLNCKSTKLVGFLYKKINRMGYYYWILYGNWSLVDDAHCTDAVVTSKLGIRTTYIVGLLHLNLTKKSKLLLYIDRSPAFLTFDDFIRSNKITIRIKWFM